MRAARVALLGQLVADGVPGVMALSHQGTRTSYATAGVANLATQEPLRTVDRYRIGSGGAARLAPALAELRG
jgi:hypothetical protein